MRATWARVVTGISAVAALAAAVTLPGTLLERKNERPLGIAAPPAVSRTVVEAHDLPAPEVRGQASHALVPLSCWIFLGETIPLARWLGIALVIAGIAIIARPLVRLEEKL